jgi:hypothetical protein
MLADFRSLRCRLAGSALALILLGTLGAADARANVVGLTPSGTLTTQTSTVLVDLGMMFDNTSTITVAALGIYDLEALTASEQVGLYNSGGTLLASATVTLGDPEVSGYLFQSVTPVVLPAGTYTVVAFTNGNEWDYGGAPLSAGGVTFLSSDYDYTNSLAFPTSTTNAASGYYGPTISIQTAAPEPGTLGLLTVAALAGCLLWRRIRVRA